MREERTIVIDFPIDRILKISITASSSIKMPLKPKEVLSIYQQFCKDVFNYLKFLQKENRLIIVDSWYAATSSDVRYKSFYTQFKVVRDDNIVEDECKLKVRVSNHDWNSLSDELEEIIPVEYDKGEYQRALGTAKLRINRFLDSYNPSNEIQSASYREVKTRYISKRILSNEKEVSDEEL